MPTTTLKIEVETTGVEKAIDALARLEDAAKKVKGALDDLGFVISTPQDRLDPSEIREMVLKAVRTTLAGEMRVGGALEDLR